MPGEHENVQPLLARSATLNKLTCPNPISAVTLNFCGLCSWLPAQMLRDTGDRLELAGAAGDGAAALDEAAAGEAASGDDAAAPSHSKKLTCLLLRAYVLNSASTHRFRIISCPLAVVHRSLTVHSWQIRRYPSSTRL